jgi:predicted NBD/HSP70 family sugar kinase
VSYWSPVLGLSPVPFAAFMRERLGVPVLLENDANLVALAEHWYGHARDLNSFVVVTVEDTIGMGLFVDGKLYRGAHGAGAELGHQKLSLDGPLCRCGLYGCLDTLASDTGVIEAACQAGYLREEDRRPTGERIAGLLARAHANEAGPAKLFQTGGEALGLALANVLNMLNPPLIIVSGAGLRAGALLTGPLLATMDRLSLPALRAATQVIFPPWRDEVWARGAATIVLRRIYETPLNASIGCSEEHHATHRRRSDRVRQYQRGLSARRSTVPAAPHQTARRCRSLACPGPCDGIRIAGRQRRYAAGRSRNRRRAEPHHAQGPCTRRPCSDRRR